jgi:hypothetical protein
MELRSGTILTSEEKKTEEKNNASQPNNDTRAKITTLTRDASTNKCIKIALNTKLFMNIIINMPFLTPMGLLLNKIKEAQEPVETLYATCELFKFLISIEDQLRQLSLSSDANNTDIFYYLHFKKQMLSQKILKLYTEHEFEIGKAVKMMVEFTNLNGKVIIMFSKINKQCRAKKLQNK